VSFFENVRDARLEGFEAELAYEAPRWFARAGYGLTSGEDMDTGEPLGGIPANELILGAGGQVPSQGLSFGWRGRFVAAQDRVPAGVEESSGYDLQEIYTERRWVFRKAGCVPRASGQGTPTRRSGPYGEEA
jgi:hemoglobin/transferrin/lactoferrin receptor protein